MSDRRALMLDYHGLAVRLAARRPNDRVLVQYLQPKTNVPIPSWAEVLPHQLKAPGISPEHLKSLIVVLPLARFAGEDDRPTLEQPPGEQPPERQPETRTEIPWWNRD